MTKTERAVVDAAMRWSEKVTLQWSHFCYSMDAMNDYANQTVKPLEVTLRRACTAHAASTPNEDVEQQEGEDQVSQRQCRGCNDPKHDHRPGDWAGERE